MIYGLRLSSEIKDIRKNLDEDLSADFKLIDKVDPADDLTDAELFLIGPTVPDAVKVIQEVAGKNKFLTIIVFSERGRYNQLKQNIQFSLFTGKNSACVIYSPSTNYTTVFKNGIQRTRQKRSFQKFNLATATKLSQLSSAAVKLDNLGHILENAPIGAILVNPDLNVIGANRSARKMFDQLEENHLSMNALFPYASIELIRNHIRQPTEEIFTVEDLNGNYHEITASHVDHHGSVNTLLLVNDVTERMMKHRRIETILESLPQISWTASADGKINYYTEAWYSYTNMGRSETVGDGWTSAVHPDDLSAVRSKWLESVHEGKTFQQAARFRKFDGEYRWHLTRAVPLYAKNRKVLLWVGTSTDIHDQVLRTESLEQMVKERTRELHETNAELEHFAHISSHDLQEPLRKIQTFAHMVKEESADMLTESLNRYVDKIIATSTRMSKLLRDLLSFTKINQQEQQEILNLDDVVGQIREDLELLILQNNATIRSENLPVIEARPLQIKQLFYNIINNALKFRKRDVPPFITITSQHVPRERLSEFKHLSPDGSYWEIVVQDNGIGFEQKYADQIFTVFQRLHTRESYDGTGIGLAIARKIVTSHRGEIFALSTPGKGSEFHIILPAISPL